MNSYERIYSLLTEGSQGLQRKRRVLKAKRYIKDADVKGAEKAVKDRIAHGKKREGEPLEDRDKKGVKVMLTVETGARNKLQV
tara:strand:+ start:77 stop:325 length:249 start_codon:yes stop_codon:yes gene_type:complete